MDNCTIIHQPPVDDRAVPVLSSGKTRGILPRTASFVRALFAFAAHLFLIPVLRRWENLRHNKQIAGTTLTHDPVFILGHWRSGTTFLHYLMACDPQFGVMTNFRTFYPWFMDAGKKSLARRLLARSIPAKRWDNMALTSDSPQEEEFALHLLTGASAYTGWYFPRRLRHFFEKYALLQFGDETDRARFGQQYLHLIKKLTAICGGKRLLLKNPPNTGRISLLLELFPNARFVYLQREPAEVFYSTLRMHEQVLDRFSATPCYRVDLPAFVPAFYARLMERYEADKTLVPPGNLVEITYEQLTLDPEQTLHAIYDALALPGFSGVLPAFRAFLETQKNFRPAVYRLSPPERAAVDQLMKTGKPFSVTL